MSVTKVTGMMQTSTQGGDIPSASPTVIDTDGDYFDVTGTTNFAAFTVVAGRRFTVQFDGALTMTHHATTLDLPGGANITTAAGDVAEFFATGTNTVQCVNYTKADGTAVALADNAITLAKMAGGTDGNIISYDASGDPVAIATGNDGQVLTSTGAGSPPAFEDAAGGAADAFMGTATWAASVTGNLAITGVGFQPTSVFMFSGISGFPAFHIGAQVDDGSEIGLRYADPATDENFQAEMNYAAHYLYETSSNKTYGNLSSFDADGFTITRSKSGSPTSAVVFGYICLKGA
jgi:hypothetical protein